MTRPVPLPSATGSPSTRLPSVLTPGTHTTRDGITEVSCATFAKAVLDAIPHDALLFRMGEAVGRIHGPPGAGRFRELDPDTTRLLVDRHVRLVASRRDSRSRGPRLEFQPCTKDLAGLVLAAARTPTSVRALTALVNYPVYLPGFIRATNGYNAGSGVFYDEPDDLQEISRIDEDPLAVLDDVINGFPYRDEASREHILAYMLTLALRPAIQGNVPGFLVRAHRERTGKTLLGRVVCMAITGAEPATLQLGSSEEEREKRITSELLQGRTAVIFDNLPAGQEIDSPALAMLFTTRMWTGRRLGKSQTPTLPNNLSVLLTGNNVMASGEIAQRLVPIHLEATSANPQERTDFPHPDPVTYARSRRREIHGAIAGLVERWKEAESPLFTTVPFGGFEGWTQIVGGILAGAGSVNFLKNLREWQVTVDDFSADAAALLADWCREELLASGERFSAPVQAKTIRERAERLDLFAQHRHGHTPAAVASVFGKRVLAVIIDRVFDARVPVGDQQEVHEVVLRRASSGSTSLYRLEDVRTLRPPTGPAPRP